MSNINTPKKRGGLFDIRHVAGLGYVVVDDLGARRGGPSPFKRQMATLRDQLEAEADKAAKRGPRPCLRCANDFHSEGIHNRLCPHCRNISSGEQSVRPSIPARKFG
ncbi:hypothetical protein EGN72_02625 [Pseudorhodobacter sp. E13]|uniref:hypothetical protein n=1 Tax=Pseudorhodobacter sp. E13 TaxID=2487931 RepID=UPI000F8D388A|nr:hypothetical protein [Pseudorhodobacter sp. E13]RUS64906.1 hypothetical protein EGN72_02625 [Pseudorhodobacter sp. E13]